MAAMTARERVFRAIRREPTDCVAAMPYMYDIAAVTAGIPLLDYYTDPVAMSKSQLELYEQRRARMSSPLVRTTTTSPRASAVSLRGTTANCRLCKNRRFPNINEVFDLEVPDPYTDGRMPVMLEAIRLTRRRPWAMK